MTPQPDCPLVPKPCPFCGQQPKILERETWAAVRCGHFVIVQEGGTFISNHDCPASLLDIVDDTLEAAILRWNTRH
jgi:hypothetical protein